MVHYREQIKQDLGFSEFVNNDPCPECGAVLSKSRFIDHMGMKHGNIERYLPEQYHLGAGQKRTSSIGLVRGQEVKEEEMKEEKKEKEEKVRVVSGDRRRSGRHSTSVQSYKVESDSDSDIEEVEVKEEDVKVKHEKVKQEKGSRYLGNTKITLSKNDDIEVVGENYNLGVKTEIKEEVKSKSSGKTSSFIKGKDSTQTTRKPRAAKTVIINDDSSDDDEIKVEEEVFTRTRSGRVSIKPQSIEVGSRPSRFKRFREENTLPSVEQKGPKALKFDKNGDVAEMLRNTFENVSRKMSRVEKSMVRIDREIILD